MYRLISYFFNMFIVSLTFALAIDFLSSFKRKPVYIKGMFIVLLFIFAFKWQPGILERLISPLRIYKVFTGYEIVDYYEVEDTDYVSPGHEYKKWWAWMQETGSAEIGVALFDYMDSPVHYYKISLFDDSFKTEFPKDIILSFSSFYY